MIEKNYTPSKKRELALKKLEQAKRELDLAQKKENEERRKKENRHKYMLGGIIVKHFQDCYQFEESELNRILSCGLATRECKQMIESIKNESGGNAMILGAKEESGSIQKGEE